MTIPHKGLAEENKSLVISLLVIHQIYNYSPEAVTGGKLIVESSRQTNKKLNPFKPGALLMGQRQTE